MTKSKVSRLSALASLVLMLAGCAGTQQHMSKAALEAHLAQEQAANQMMLLNLVRANLGYPLHFSKVDSMSISAGDATPTVGLSLGFLAADGNPGRGLTLGATGTRPTLEVVPQDSKEFVQGLSTPLGVDWMAYFVNQGWDVSLVVSLLIERVELSVAPADDSKDARPTYKPNAEALYALRDCAAIELEPEPGKGYGPVVSGADLLGKISLVEARKAGLSIETIDPPGKTTVDGRFQLHEPPSVVVVKFRCGDKPVQAVRANSPSSARLARSAESNLPPPAVKAGESRIVMRSAARMIRHLGSSATVHGVSSDRSAADLIRWYVGEPAAEADVAVSAVYAGKTYWIARSDTQTIKVLALMNHVLLLKGSTSEAPSAETVRVRVIPR